MTALDNLLQGLEVDVEAFAVCDVRAGWHLDAPALGRIAVHYTLQGEGELHFTSGERVAFAPGTLLIAPPATAARITVDASVPTGLTQCAPAATALPWLQSSGDNATPQVLLACGTAEAASATAHALFDSLRQPLVEHCSQDPRITGLLDTLLAEIAAPGLGTRGLTGALMKQCLILVLRRLAAAGDQRLPWLRALNEPGLNHALQYMMEHPAEPVSVEHLAEMAHMSRSRFADRFHEIVGVPPGRFLSELRLHWAARELRSRDTPIKTIAAQAGYRSRSHFSHAFKAHFGCDPGRFRRG